MNKWRSLKSAYVKKILSFTLALGLCIGAVTVFPMLSKAADKVDLKSACSLTAKATSTTDKAILDDLDKANVVMDLYKIADAVENKRADGYTFEVVDPYLGIVDLPKGTTADEWMGVSQKAASVVKAYYTAGTPIVPTQTVESGKAADQLEAGLYLVLARGEGIVDYFIETDNASASQKDIFTMATGADYEYFFAPEIVALPTKDPNPTTGEIDLSAQTEWKYSTTIYMKPYWEPRFGDLKIIKDLRDFETSEPAFFIFQVDTEKKYGDVVKKTSNVYTLKFTEAKEEYLVIKDLPVGADVTVTEINSGATYKIQGSDTQNTTIVANDVVDVRFTNTYTNYKKKGGAITNHFDPVLDENGSIKLDEHGQPVYTWSVYEDSTEEVAN